MRLPSPRFRRSSISKHGKIGMCLLHWLWRCSSKLFTYFASPCCLETRIATLSTCYSPVVWKKKLQELEKIAIIHLSLIFDSLSGNTYGQVKLFFLIV